MLPAWAEWNDAAAKWPWTVGVEEEQMLLDPRDWTLASRGAEVLAVMAPWLAERSSAETHASALELTTAPHGTVAGAVAELGDLRDALDRALAPLGLRAAVAGTHPSVVWHEVEVSRGPRYRRIHATMRALAQREPTFALHVHVAVPDGETAVRALDGLREDLPLLLALSANSPFWQGRDTGLASMRTPILSMFPRFGLPRRFGDFESYVRTVDELLRSGAIPDPSHLWWDARLQPRLGTLEVRIMDAATRVDDAAPLVAFVQSLVCLYAQGGGRRESLTPEALSENRFLAARDGMRARFVAAGGERELATSRLAARLEDCAPLAQELRCRAELEALTVLAEAPGHTRQRAVAEDQGLVGLVAQMHAQHASAPRAAAA